MLAPPSGSVEASGPTPADADLLGKLGNILGDFLGSPSTQQGDTLGLGPANATPTVAAPGVPTNSLDPSNTNVTGQPFVEALPG
jgi:hypothetical protein